MVNGIYSIKEIHMKERRNAEICLNLPVCGAQMAAC